MENDLLPGTALQRHYKPLEAYGIIGNLETCALVASDGSIDWYCYPHLESPSVFASLLDCHKGGNFMVAPSIPFESQQSYRQNTNVLSTVFRTEAGIVTLTDFMPVQGGNTERPHDTIELVRLIECTEGAVPVGIRVSPRFEYARVLPQIKLSTNGFTLEGGGQKIGFAATRPCNVSEHRIEAFYTLAKGEIIALALFRDAPLRLSVDSCLEIQRETEAYWRGWVHACSGNLCVFDGPWHDAVIRSGLVLKLLTHRDSGAIAAAATTSVPEWIGGVRNWDYRYAWVRDASFTVQALHNLGHVREAEGFFRWMRSILRKGENPADLRIMYGLHGGTSLTEVTLNHLSGYMDSRPVRIGNGASTQRQLDIFGELILALYETSRYGIGVPPEEWDLVAAIADYVSDAWKNKDAGIWEVRGGDRHFTYSKLMCWVALDRALRMARRRQPHASLPRWTQARADIRSAILHEGYNERRKSFVQSFGSDTLDATSLLIPVMGFLSHNDPRVRSTLDATIKELAVGGKVYRYRGDDGLPGGEGAFMLCSFWLITALALAGKKEQAKEYLADVLRHAGPTMLLSEEIDTSTGRLLGNLPQAFSHIGLINSVLYIGRGEGKMHLGPSLAGSDIAKEE